jgi:hypothetical protein
MKKRTCRQCIHIRESSYGGRYEPETYDLECKYMNSKNPITVEMVEFIQENTEDELIAETCCLFDAGKCDECGSKIHEFFYSEGIYGEPFRCCSKECKEISDKKIDKIIKENFQQEMF